MALIVIAGMASCPKYAQAEFIAGVLSTKLPHFKVRRMAIDKDDWKNWLWGECKKNDWSHTKSPLVWRELAMPGGKPVLIGGLSEFLEYCHEYYGLTAFLTPEEKQMLVDDNIKINEREMEEKARSQYKVRKILISGATLRILPVLLSELLNLKCVGKEAGTVIHIYDKSKKKHIIEQIQKDSTLMGADTGVEASKIVDTLQEGLADCDVFIIMNVFSRADEKCFDVIIKQNYAAMVKLAQVIDDYAPPECRVILAGADDAPVCFNATVLANVSEKLDSKNVVVVTAHLGTEAMPVMTKLTETKLCDMACPAVWGFTGINHYIDFENMIYKATYFVPNKRALKRIPNSTLPQGKLIIELRRFNYLMENVRHLWKYIHQYQTQIKESTEEPPELPKVKAITTLLKLWYTEDYDGEVISLGIKSDGTFGIPPGIFFSQPVVLKDHTWRPYADYPRPDIKKCDLDGLINGAMYMLLDHAKGVIMRYSSMWQYVDYETFKLEDRVKREAAYRYPEYPDPWKAIKESRIRNEIGISRALYRIELKWKLDEQERLGH